MNEEQIPQIVQLVRSRLAALRDERKVDLALEERDYRLEDDWLYLCVTPTRAGVRASDYAELMAGIEKELRAQGIDNVLLVPAIDE